MGVLEIIGLGNLEEATFTGSLSAPFEDFMHTIALTSLVGQIAILISFACTHRSQIALYLLGLLFLWVSVIYLLMEAKANNDSHSGGLHASWVVCMPFFVSSLWPLFRLAQKRLKRENKPTNT